MQQQVSHEYLPSIAVVFRRESSFDSPHAGLRELAAILILLLSEPLYRNVSGKLFVFKKFFIYIAQFILTN